MRRTTNQQLLKFSHLPFELCLLIIKSWHVKIYNLQIEMLETLKEGSLRNSGILDHLCELVRHEVSDKNQLKSLNQIEILSYFIRTHRFKFDELLKDEQLKKKIAEKKEYSDYVCKLTQVLDTLNKVQNKKIYTCPDLETQCHALKTAGICIGQNNYFYLAKVMRTLAIKNCVKQIRFWGKILGKQDYYVIEGICDKPYLADISPDLQPYGTGVNTYSYWVATDILGEWCELPLVTPEQVKLSRDLKIIFSGKLDQNLNKMVKFPGQEKHLLKCIIARITHGCQLAPKGLYKLSENDPNVLEFEEQFKLPEVAEMANLDNWIHLPPHIMNQGRTTHYINPSLTQEEKDAKKQQLQAKQATVERLKPIADQKPTQVPGIYSHPANWTAKLCGQTIPVSLIGRQEGQSTTYGVVVLKNMSWPGAATVCYRGGWINIYVGYGHRETQQIKLIKGLPDFEGEGVDVDEKPEPNPSKAPEPVVAQQKPAEGGEEEAS